MKLTNRNYYTSLILTALLSIACAALIPFVNVNSDMTKYLPNDSPMKHGIDLLKDEFGGAKMTGADIRAMFGAHTEPEKKEIAAQLGSYPDVEAVQYRTSEDGEHTLFELTVPKTVDQKSLGAKIRSDMGEDTVVETSQDGATPPVSVMVIAAALILLILFLMCESWIEPVLFMGSTGMGILLNVGTNYFLPSVSITTNYIVAILQLVLSLDYSIVMMNRYRQERRNGMEPVDALNSAIPKAATAIISSATTTIVGLLMLCFMRLKIGMDMGIVLAKGVVFSLICSFTALPAMILIFRKAVEATEKKGFRIPTGLLGRISGKFRIPLVAMFLVLFVGSAFLHHKTDIRFSTNGQSRIDEVFPRKNTVVMLYDNADEGLVNELADSISTIEGVESIFSYPTILLKEYTADEMVSAMMDMAKDLEGAPGTMAPDMAGIPALDLLSSETLRIAYYMKEKGDTDLSIGFPELAEFISEDCLNNPLISSMIDDSMKEKVDLLNDLTGMDFAGMLDEEEEIFEAAEQPAVPVSELASKEESRPAETKKEAARQEETPVEIVIPVVKNSGEISIIEFVRKFHESRNDDLSADILTLVDTTMLNTKLAAQAMGKFVGSTPTQTRMVFSFSKSKTMTPIEYVHFLNDDLFNRKALQSMVSEGQKNDLRARIKVMDSANSDAKLSAGDIAGMMHKLGVSDMNEASVKNLMFPPAVETPVAANTVAGVHQKEDEAIPELVATDSTITVADVKEIPAVATVPVRKAKPAPKKSPDEIRQEMFTNMMYSGKTYTAAQMADNFKNLGEEIDPELVKMLYTYYGSVKEYDEDWKMSIKDIIDFLSEAIINNDAFSVFVDEETRSGFEQMSGVIEQGVGMMKNKNHSIAVVFANLPDESPATYDFIEKVDKYGSDILAKEHFMVGESVMFDEMKNNFKNEMNLVTWLTIISIFLIVALTFQSLIVPVILVMTVMTSVFVNVIFSGLGGNTMLYLAYLISQSILMGATIDYGILYTNYYKEKRKTLDIPEAIKEAYKGSINTIMTSGLIMAVAPGVMSLLVNDPTISAIVGCISVGALVALILILLVLPGLLATFDRLVVFGWAGRRKLKDIRKQ